MLERGTLRAFEAQAVLRRLLTFELAGWRALVTWPRRKRPGSFPYTSMSGLNLTMGTVFGLLFIELPGSVFLASLFIPWGWVRVVLGFVSLYALWWWAVLWAGLVTRPHSVAGSSVQLFSGLAAACEIPLGSIRSVQTTRRTWPRAMGCVVADDGSVAMPAGSDTNLKIELDEPVAVTRLFAGDVAASTLYVFADDPAGLARALAA